MVKCNNCGAELPNDSRFCSECGQPVPQVKTCPQCGAECPNDARFCMKCGYSFTNTKSKNIETEVIQQEEQTPINKSYDLTEYESLSLDEQISAADKLLESDDAEKAFNGVALVEYIGNNLACNMKDAEKLESLVDIVCVARYSTILNHIPEEAKEAFKELEALADKGCEAAYEPLIEAYTKGIGTNVDEVKADYYSQLLMKSTAEEVRPNTAKRKGIAEKDYLFYLKHIFNSETTGARIEAEQKAKNNKDNNKFPDTVCSSDEEYFECPWSSYFRIKDEYKPYIKHIIVDEEFCELGEGSCERITVNDICRRLEIQDNESLVTIDGGVNLERIDLRGCDNLNYSIEDDIKYYGTWAIEVIDKTLTTYRLRENTTLLNDSLFLGCKQLHHITIPSKIAVIPRACFFGSGLTMIDLPENITDIGYDAFENCKQLREVHIRHPHISADSYSFPRPLKNITFYVPKDSLSYYKSNDAFKGKLLSGVKIKGE